MLLLQQLEHYLRQNKKPTCPNIAPASEWFFALDEHTQPMVMLCFSPSSVLEVPLFEMWLGIACPDCTQSLPDFLER